jgi:hypothetical protein
MEFRKDTGKTETEIENDRKKGNALVMETDNFHAEYLFADDLRILLQTSDTNLDFVFIATCYS